MKQLTAALLATIYAPTKAATCEPYIFPITQTMLAADITSLSRLSVFLGQVGVESGRLTRMVENLNYRDPTRLDAMFSAVHGVEEAKALIAKGQEAIGNRVYANRLGNGNEASGDGFRYRGAGGIECTGKDNHAAFGKSIGMPVEKVPDYLRTPEGAMRVSGWFWTVHRLNVLADKQDIDGITRIVNGPAMAAAGERRALTTRARTVLA